MISTVQDIAALFSAHAGKRVLISTHINPDGDAIGSSVAFAYIIQALGGDVFLHYASGIPENYGWLTLPCPWVHNLEDLALWVPEMIILTDCGDAERAGAQMGAFFLEKKMPASAWEYALTVNIDHHLGNPYFAQYNLVDPKATATGQLAGMIAKELSLPLSQGLGEAVYLTLVADSGQFSYSNTKPPALRMAAEIVENGLNIGEFTARVENQWTLNRMHLWGRLMRELTLHGNGAVVSCLASIAIMKEYNTSKDDLEGFVSWMRRLKGVQASVFLREDSPSECKLSIRSMGELDVRQVAVIFGGGGHKVAAGATMPYSLPKSLESVLEKLLPLCR